jgi:hypothetical protein
VWSWWLAGGTGESFFVLADFFGVCLADFFPVSLTVNRIGGIGLGFLKRDSLTRLGRPADGFYRYPVNNKS